MKLVVFVGWFFILTSYSGATRMLEEGAYTKAVIGGFSTKAQCETSAANFPSPDHTSNPKWFVANGQGTGIYQNPYNEASPCYQGTPVSK